jgi:23S rRNA (adenine2503-C2)-methyltransferase
MIKKRLCGLTADDIFRLIEPSGFNFSHAVSVSNSIYKKRVSDVLQIKNIPGRLRSFLSDNCIPGYWLPVYSENSVDETVKYLFRTESGKEFETVYIPDNKRNTVCVSTQAGCRMGCKFCATAGYGYHGQLTAGEIVSQVISLPHAQKVTHVVFMGMGEPLDNLENVLKACDIITSEWGLALTVRNVTVSTVGLTDGVEMFLRDSDCNMTLSLHSPFREERSRFIPAEINNPSQNILSIMKRYPVKKKRRLSVAYLMMEGINDSDNHLEELKSLLKDTKIRVNLLPYHSGDKYPVSSSFYEKMMKFKHGLIVSGISASIRKSRGIDITAACGMLAKNLK